MLFFIKFIPAVTETIQNSCKWLFILFIPLVILYSLSVQFLIVVCILIVSLFVGLYHCYCKCNYGVNW